VRRKHLDKGRAMVEADRSNCAVDETTEFVANEERRLGAPFVHLFRERRTVGDAALWVVNFMNLLNLYALANWLAIVVRSMGYSTRRRPGQHDVAAWRNDSGASGLAWLIAKGGFMRTLIGQLRDRDRHDRRRSVSPASRCARSFIIVFIAGWCIVGGQPWSQRAGGDVLPNRICGRPASAGAWASAAWARSSARTSAACCSRGSGVRSSCSSQPRCRAHLHHHDARAAYIDARQTPLDADRH
jgi:AAHS family 4-hydroxybenzoate transporter-like MFS transporter